MKKYIIYILISITTLTFAQKENNSNEQKEEIITTKTKNLIRKGNKFYNDGLYLDAEKSYKKAIELNPNYDKANYNYGNSLFAKNKPKEAKTQYELVSKTTKDDFIKADADHNLGNLAMKEKQYAPAVEAYKNSLRKNPNDDETRYNLAVAQKLLKKQENKDKDKGKDKDKDKDKKDDKGDKKKDKNDKNKKDDKGKDKKDDNDKGKKDDKDKGKNEKDKKKQEQPKPKPSKLSPEQVKELLKTMNNEENKTQKKINAKKERGKKVKQDKDW